MREMGVSIHVVRAGHANMFQSPLFAEVFATSIQAHLELYNTDGSQGAARGAGMGAGLYKGFNQAFSNLKVVNAYQPNRKLKSVYDERMGVGNSWLRNHNMLYFIIISKEGSNL